MPKPTNSVVYSYYDNTRIVNYSRKCDNAIINNSTNTTIKIDNCRNLEFIGVYFDGNWSCPYHFAVGNSPNRYTRNNFLEILS